MDNNVIDLFAEEPVVNRTSKPVKAKGWIGLTSHLLPLLMIPKKILVFIVIFFFIGFFWSTYLIIAKFWEYAIAAFLLFLIYRIFNNRKKIMEWIKKLKIKK